MSLKPRIGAATRPAMGAIAILGSALAIGAGVAKEPALAAAGAAVAALLIGAVAVPGFLAAGAPALFLLASSGRLELLLPVALLVVVVARKLASRSAALSIGQGWLVAFSVWIGLNFALHYGGFSESASSDLSPAVDAATLIDGMMLALAGSWLDIPRRFLFYLTAGTITFVAVITILQGSPEAVLFGMNRNYLGMVIALGVAIAAMMIHRRNAILWLAVLLAMIWALAILQSRGATIAAGSGVLLAALVRVSGGFWGRRTALAAACIVTFVAIAVTASPSLPQAAQFGRAESDLTVSNTARFAAVEVALATTANNPVFGIGYGRFGIIAYNDPRLNQYINTHNEYLRIAAELGLPGIALFLLTLYAAMKGLMRSKEQVGLVLFATYLVGLLFANTLSNLLVTAPFWLCIGLGLRGLQSPTQIRSHAP